MKANSNTEDAAGADPADLFEKYIRLHATRFFGLPEGTACTVHLVRRQHRPRSVLYEFAVAAGGRETSLIVKVPASIGTPGVTMRTSRGSRPRLVKESSDAASICAGEHRALAAIEQHFLGLNDRRFGVVRVFAHLPEHCALLVEKVPQPSLRQLVMSSWWRRAPDDVLVTAFCNAGAWLRRYHAMPKEEDVTERHTRRTAVLAFMEEVSGYLAAELQDEKFYRSLFARLQVAVNAALPEFLPLGLGHGDYALRNILVGAAGRVTVLDTRARWRTAIYEDLGYFLASLKSSWPQVFSRGLALSSGSVAEYEHAFLEGYFQEDEKSHAAVRLFELLAMLDKLAWLASSRSAGGSSRLRLLRSVQVASFSRFLRQAVDRAFDSM